MHVAWSVIVLAVVAGATSPAREVPDWLAGCWASAQDGRLIQERWSPLAGGVMLGTSQTVQDDRTTAWEFLRIEVREVGPVLVALPSGQALAEFPAIEATDSLVVFANPAHDFPQRITYRRLPTGELATRVEGPRGGFDGLLRRVPCE